jgi:hypothetical protein
LRLFITIKSNKSKFSVEASGIPSSIVHSNLVSQIVKELPSVYETVRFIATFTTVYHLAYSYLPAD